MDIKDIIYPNLIVDERNNYYFCRKCCNKKLFLQNAIEILYKNNKNNRDCEWELQFIQGKPVDEKEETIEIDPAQLIKQMVDEIQNKNSPLKITNLEQLQKEYEIIFLNPWE